MRISIVTVPQNDINVWRRLQGVVSWWDEAKLIALEALNGTVKRTKEYKGEEVEEAHIQEWTDHIRCFEGFGVLVVGDDEVYSNKTFVKKMREFEEKRYIELGMKK